MLDDLEFEVAAPWASESHLLDIGCGTGLILQRLAKLATRAEGVDLSPEMLSFARKKRLSVCEGDACSLPFGPETFDVVVSFKTLAHVPDLSRALAEMSRVLRPNGIAIFETYNFWSTRTLIKRVVPRRTSREFRENDVYCRYDDAASVQRALPPKFTVVRVRGIRTWIVAAQCLDLPFFGPKLEQLERATADTAIGRWFGGFTVWVVRKQQK
jgi:SAM-dependent methyltransferase